MMVGAAMLIGAHFLFLVSYILGEVATLLRVLSMVCALQVDMSAACCLAWVVVARRLLALHVWLPMALVAIDPLTGKAQRLTSFVSSCYVSSWLLEMAGMIAQEIELYPLVLMASALVLGKLWALSWKMSILLSPAWQSLVAVELLVRVAIATA